MRIVFLNVPICTSHGTYTYAPASLDDIRGLVAYEKINGTEFFSAIGHEATAQIMSELLEMGIEVNRVSYKQEPGDICIVFKVNGRILEGKILSREELDEIGYCFGILAKEK